MHSISKTFLSALAAGTLFAGSVLAQDVDPAHSETVKRIVLCTGKIAYPLIEARDEAGASVSVVRVEQLYPFPADEYAAVIRKYAQAHEIVWCQEEPQNQGAWYQIRHRLNEPLSREHRLLYAGRAPAAAPATGIAQMHMEQQKQLVDAALRSTSAEETLQQTSRLRAAGEK